MTHFPPIDPRGIATWSHFCCVTAASLVLSLSVASRGEAQATADRETENPPRVHTFSHAEPELIHRQLPPLYCGHRAWDFRCKHADLVFIGRLDADAQWYRADVTSLTVTSVLKGLELAPGDRVSVPLTPLIDGATRIIVFCAIDGTDAAVVTERNWISSDMADFFTGLSNAPNPTDRFQYLLKMEYHGRPEISARAFFEFAALPDTRLSDPVQQLPSLWLMDRIKSRDIEPERRAFFFRLLGLKGDRNDLPFIERWAFSPSSGAAQPSKEVYIAYLKIGGASAARHLNSRFFRFPDNTQTFQKISRWEMTGMEHAAMALRRLRHKPGLADSFACAAHRIAHDPLLCDLIVEAAIEDGDCRFVTPALHAYMSLDSETSNQRLVLRYLSLVRRNPALPDHEATLIDQILADLDAKEREWLIAIARRVD